MPDLVLPGCRTTPLAGYLSALGILRAVTRCVDDEAAGYWRRGAFVLRSTVPTVEALVAVLDERFEPEAIVSPWNAGSGFAGNGKNTTAEAALDWVRASHEPSLTALRDAVEAADRVVARGRQRGWGGKNDALWDPARKRDVLQLCRNEFPDAALAWLDAATALTGDTDVAFSRLLGTGGNFGRQDLSVTYLARVRTITGDRRSRRWLTALLTGDESAPYLRDAVGQFDPGRAGGIQSSPLEKADDKGFVNPWAFLMTVEGTLLFASAVVRRHGADYAGAALPFQVQGSASGFATAAPGESALGEFLAPEWAEPTRLPELAALLGEGKALWRAKPARSALDFVRAAANLAVDRRITAMHRHAFVDRHGQNPLAVPAGAIVVPRTRRPVELLAGLDPWLDALRSSASNAVAARVRGVEQTLFAHAKTGDPADLVAVFAALGRCHETAARAGRTRQFVSPLVLPHGRALADELRHALPDDPELRVALALATARDPGADCPTLGGLRALLSPVAAGPRRRPVWSGRPSTVSLGQGLVPALASLARRRSMPRPDEPDNAVPFPAVRGARISFDQGMFARPSDVQALLAGHLDELRIADLLAGLVTVDWAGTDFRLPPVEPGLLVSTVNYLLPFASTAALELPGKDGVTTWVRLRPGNAWPARLIAGRVADVLDDAARRLTITGIPQVLPPPDARVSGDRLAAVLLFRITERDRIRALHRIAVLPTPERSAQ
ncbi:type I-G CRISPR-associated protein Cas8g1/Csx17 [Amycolatopsis panacis]|uniref:Type I-U CRISPR-associated protein Csx17 n=1 Tax=Amycolatopsis panacis TaxID=2340917 RepID=A0A419I746_9PSEU|nr:type I-U CRISPR-associated protein Csx17 [Amycolatopsis panacis]RJQ87484.1 type I-U CRISPR-associated protein Csx17 [Amycolatopsis panacis]